MSKSLFKMNKKIKNICTLLRNAYISNKEYVVTKDISSNIRYILFFLKRKGLILSFELKDNLYEIKLNLKEKRINFFYHEGLRGRKISKKSIPLLLGFNQKIVLMYSNNYIFKIFTIEESYSYNLGGVVIGILII